jgi:Uma2 family endonuclease
MTTGRDIRPGGVGINGPGLSLEEFLLLPETEPASEFQDGRIEQKVSPQGSHSVLQFEIASRLNSAARKSRSGFAFPELRCTFSGRSIVPDVSFVAWHRIPRKPNGKVAEVFFLAPDMSIEIVSPEQAIGPLIEKLTFCVENGVRLGWLIDPEANRVMVFEKHREPVTLKTGSLSAEPVISGLSLTVEEVFGWLSLPR